MDAGAASAAGRGRLAGQPAGGGAVHPGLPGRFARRAGPARYGGDEFVILCPAGADGLAQRIERALADPFVVAGEPAAIGVSVGVARATPGTDADALLRRADDAMHTAKSARKAARPAAVPQR